jgi:hypothetical protein
MMALSKNIQTLRKLIEETLRRRRSHGRSPNYEPGEVVKMLAVLKVLVMDRRVFVLADTSRFAQDFLSVTGIIGRYAWSTDQLQGFDNLHVIILHTGPRTPKQEQLHQELTDYLITRTNIAYWNIGEWRE